MAFRTKLGRRLMALAALLPDVREFKAEDLGQTYEERYGGDDCVRPAGYDYKKEKSYPSFYIDGRANPLKLGEEGTAQIKYRVTSSSINERGGKKRHGYGIDVLSIDPKKSKTPKNGSGHIDIAPETAKLLGDLRPGMIELGKIPLRGNSLKAALREAQHGPMMGKIRMKPVKVADHKTPAKLNEQVNRIGSKFQYQKGARTDARAGVHGAVSDYLTSEGHHPLVRNRRRDMSATRPGMIALSTGARGSDGQYADTDAGAVTPNQIHAAYRTPPPTPAKKKGGILGALRRMAGGG